MAPPAWTRLFLRIVLPCDGMREAIFGDLHEEFVRDLDQLGPRLARRRYRDRVVGILAHAVWDSFRWRTWASTSAGAESAAVSSRARGAQAGDAPSGLRLGLARMRQVGGLAAVTVAALGFLVLGIYVNTSVFSAVEGSPTGAGAAGALAGGLPDPLTLIAIGVGGVILMVGCSAIAAFVICLAPRWRGTRIPTPRDP